MPRAESRTFMPRCDGCVTKNLVAGHPVLLPQTAIARSEVPVYLHEVDGDVWPETYDWLLNANAEFVCVRMGETALLLATTVPLGEDSKPQNAVKVAGAVESAIVLRPHGVTTRFVASPAWGGQPPGD